MQRIFAIKYVGKGEANMKAFGDLRERSRKKHHYMCLQLSQ